ncbi:hypothetical protein IKF04_01785 [Candidatus Saccharibacteria bacterium]|nr:hypothetical protein [Candidatus Saccharibacteria bacterium]
MEYIVNGLPETQKGLNAIFGEESAVAVLVVGPRGYWAERALSSIKAVFNKKTVFDQSYASKIAGGLPEKKIEECLGRDDAAIVWPGHWTCNHQWRHGAVQALERLGAKTVVVFFIDPPIRVVLWEIYRKYVSLEALWQVVWLKMNPPSPDGVDFLIKVSE